MEGIKINRFRLTPSTGARWVFDLYENKQRIDVKTRKLNPNATELAVAYGDERLEIGFNVNYLIDVLNVLSGNEVKITLADSNSSALLEESEDGDSVYVIMPMRL